jgi:hypothetical protein
LWPFSIATDVFSVGIASFFDKLFSHMMLQDRINRALSPLIGLRLWGAARCLNLEMFAFGERTTRLNRTGEEVEVGEFALHVQCPWRIVGPTGLVVGSEDRKYPDDENADWEEFDANGPSRCEARMNEWLEEYAEAPLKVKRVESDHIGGFRLLLEHGFVLEVFPANSLRGEHSEHWRFFRPSSEGHFVLTGHGVEE